jgi:hypothetical protein
MGCKVTMWLAPIAGPRLNHQTIPGRQPPAPIILPGVPEGQLAKEVRNNQMVSTLPRSA